MIAEVSKSSGKIVFVGSGLSTLVIAQSLLRKGVSGSNIVIVENSPELGGQYSSVRSKDRVFDLGMHIFYETGVEEIDSCFIDIQPNDWIYLTENQKDVAGIFWNGALQTNSPYPDLRKWKVFRIVVFFSILTSFIHCRNVGVQNDAQTALRNHFGHIPTKFIFSPILNKLYDCDARLLDKAALKLTAMNRVVLFEERFTKLLMKSRFLRARIAYPEQLKLPNIRRDYGRGIYPKSFGFDTVVRKLVDSLTEAGVKIHANTEVLQLNQNDSTTQVESIVLSDSEKTLKVIENVHHIFWMAIPLRIPGQILKQLKLNPMNFKTTGRKVFVNILLRKYPQSSYLYYFYVFDPSSNIFRVTNYSAYSWDSYSANGGYFPVTVEYWAQKM